MPRITPHALPTEPIWRQQPTESNAAYRGFLAFRDLGTMRTVHDTVRKLRDLAIGQPDPHNRRLTGRMAPWVAPWRWMERVKAWDIHLQADRDEVLKAYAARWEKRRIDALEETWATGQQLLDKARKMLEMPIVDRVTEDGLTTIKAARWTFQTASEMSRLGTEMKQRATETAMPPADECEDIELEAIVEAAHRAKGGIPSVQVPGVEAHGDDDEPLAEADGRPGPSDPETPGGPEPRRPRGRPRRGVPPVQE
jgi:hypothetical protein